MRRTVELLAMIAMGSAVGLSCEPDAEEQGPAAHCSNGIQDAEEGDVDCGGKAFYQSDCPPCGDWMKCGNNDDRLCESGNCQPYLYQDGREDDLDFTCMPQGCSQEINEDFTGRIIVCDGMEIDDPIVTGGSDSGTDGGDTAGGSGDGSGGPAGDCGLGDTLLWKYTAPQPEDGDDLVSYLDFGYGAEAERVFLFQRRVSFDPPDYGACGNGVYNETLRSGEYTADLPPSCPADESSLSFPTDEDTFFIRFEHDTYALSCTAGGLTYIGYVWNENCANEPRSGDFEPRETCDLPVCECAAVWGDFHTCDPPGGC